MYGVIEFLKRNYFVLLFAALEFLSVFFVVKDNYYHQAGFFNSANSVAGSVYKSYSGITSYFNLKKVNGQLAAENTRLHAMLLKEQGTSSHPGYQVTNKFGQHYSYILAQVIDNSTNRVNNYITLDAGSKQGVARDMGVISPSGVVGIVVNVSENYSVVMSLLHTSCRVSAMLKKDGTFGTLHWQGKDYRYATLSQIPMSETLKAGDTIVTSGYSGIFPKETPVGNIVSFDSIPARYFYSIKVKLSTDFKDLRYVYVIVNLMKDEKTKLEKNTYNTFKQQ